MGTCVFHAVVTVCSQAWLANGPTQRVHCSCRLIYQHVHIIEPYSQRSAVVI
jgi:hypothetical protein